MAREHFPDYQGPPWRREEGVYRLLLLIAGITSTLQFFVAFKFAHSGVAEADALHALTHGLLYGLAIYVGRIVKNRSLSEKDEQKLRAQYGFWNAIILFAVLGYVVFWETIPKFIHPVIVHRGFMLLSVSIGLSGNIPSLMLLKKINPGHETHSWLSFDILADLRLSLAVLISVPFINMVPLLDPILTCFAVIWIGITGYTLFVTKTLKNI